MTAMVLISNSLKINSKKIFEFEPVIEMLTLLSNVTLELSIKFIQNVNIKNTNQKNQFFLLSFFVHHFTE
jgi:hypothetical protein